MLRRRSSGRQLRIVITPPVRWSLPSFGRLWEAREVLARFAARDITLRYRQTALGVLWVVLQPLLAAGVLSFVFGNVAKLPSGGVPSIVYTFAGLLLFNLMNTVITRGSMSLVGNSSLVSKLYFPRLLIPLSTAGSALMDFVVSLAFMSVLFGIYGIGLPGPAVVLVPVWVVLTICLAEGIAFVTSALMVSYRDVGYMVPFLLQVMLYASPVAYSLGKIPAHYRIFYDINPMTWLLADIRWSLLHQPQPSVGILLLSVVVPLAVLMVGSFVFQQLERGFADVI
ncbi:MAG TPA: ABC transporter permease [Acidimicrobiales bacterium]|nr:ABC transporter permease [Acidimicrobiales bacterium]